MVRLVWNTRVEGNCCQKCKQRPKVQCQIKTVQIVHQFKPENETDLPLEKGQLVIGNFVEDDWWVGEDPATGRTGRI